MLNDNLLTVIIIGLFGVGLASAVVYLAQKRPLARSVNGESKLANMVTLLTDDLAVANQKIGSMLTEIAQLKAMVSQLQAVIEVYQGSSDSQTILIGIGTDLDLAADLVRLRGVRNEKGSVNLLRLLPITSVNLSKVLQSARERNRAIRWVHLATKATPKGVEFADGTCTGAWLSGEMSDVKVLLIAGCNTFDVGDTLSGIPLVATTLEQISHDDAKVLTGVFWQAVVDGLAPSQIEARCRERLPTRIMEMISMLY